MATLIDEVEKFVDNSNKIMGAVNVEHVQNDVQKYLNFTLEDLDRMSKEDCVVAQYFLMQYSTSLTKKINKIKYRLAANKKTFERLLSQVYNTYNTYNGQAIVTATACSEHAHLRQIDNENTKMEALIQDNEMVSHKLEKISEIFKNLSFCRS